MHRGRARALFLVSPRRSAKRTASRRNRASSARAAYRHSGRIRLMPFSSTVKGELQSTAAFFGFEAGFGAAGSGFFEAAYGLARSSSAARLDGAGGSTAAG